MAAQSPYWILTIPFRGSFGSELVVKKWFLKHTEAGRFRYAKVACEVGGHSDYVHLQVYVIFENRVTFARVKGLFPRETHIEPRRGSHTEAKDYIGNEEKSGSVAWVAEFGSDDDIPDRAGDRSDVSKTDSCLLLILGRLQAGENISDLWNEPELFPTLVKYHRGVNEYLSHRFKVRQVSKVVPISKEDEKCIL